MTGGIPDVPDKELPHLVAGYRKLIPLLDTSAARMAERHRLLFGFGFDEEGTLADGATADAKQLKDYVKLIAHCTKYSHLPGQRAKIQNFGPYAHHGERLYQTLAHSAIAATSGIVLRFTTTQPIFSFGEWCLSFCCMRAGELICFATC